MNAADNSKIPCLSIQHPYAHWHIYGVDRAGKTIFKDIETRTWKIPERYLNKWIIIVSSKRIHPNFKNIHMPYLEYGMALGAVKYSECRKMTLDDEKAAMCAHYDGAYSWVVADRIIFKESFPLKGMLGIFTIDKIIIEGQKVGNEVISILE